MYAEEKVGDPLLKKKNLKKERIMLLQPPWACSAWSFSLLFVQSYELLFHKQAIIFLCHVKNRLGTRLLYPIFETQAAVSLSFFKMLPPLFHWALLGRD